MNKDSEIIEEEIDPPVVNRMAVAVKVKQPYIDWANGLPDNSGMIVTADKINEKPTTFLMPNYETESSIEKFLQKAKPRIFAQQLNAWCTDPDWWPEDLSAREFNKWFDLEVSEMIFDLVENESLDHVEY